MTAFDQLSPAMQYQVVNGLGFRELRPVQELAIPPILAGKNCVVLAPTAGGKTESAFFPLFSAMDRDDWRPVSVIYVAPIRALLNNQEERLSRYAALVGRRVFKWHGDTSQADRKRFIREPADVLLTTPESLEVMMLSPHIPARRLFDSLRAVVIDEVHAFVSDDRGGHLSALLERLSRFCGHDVQRIALSATVGNPERILGWAAGSSTREREVVRAPGERARPELVLDCVGSMENAARVIAGLHQGSKRLVFLDSRAGVEKLGASLRATGVDTFVLHSSLSQAERQRAEEAFAHGRDRVIVATSALELGIDIGDLDHVIQIGAPKTVAAFLQRMGRTGRRPGTTPNCTFLCVDDESLLQAAGLLRLHARGYVEPVHPVENAAHLLAHQIIALGLQEGGIGRGDYWAWIGAATPFAGLSEADRSELVEHMLREEILHDDGGRLSLGARGEKLYGFRNFQELYAVFSTPEILKVMWGSEEVGSIESYFAEQEDPAKLVFLLGARAWKVTSIDWSRGVAHVQPAERGAPAVWGGAPIVLHRELCLAMRSVLVDDEKDAPWSRRAQERIGSMRAEHEFLREEPLPLSSTLEGYRLWTFAGAKGNALLARVLEGVLGGKVAASNLSLHLRDDAGKSVVGIRAAVEDLRSRGRPNEDDSRNHASAGAHERLSKFQPCLTGRLESAYLASALLSATDAASALAPYSG